MDVSEDVRKPSAQELLKMSGLRNLIISFSVVLTGVVISNGYYRERQFFPFVVYITKTQPSLSVSFTAVCSARGEYIEVDVCDVTVSVYPHRASLKDMPACPRWESKLFILEGYALFKITKRYNRHIFQLHATKLQYFQCNFLT